MYEPPKRRKLTKQERQAIYDKCNGHCAYCGTSIELRQMQADHIIPMELYEAYKANGEDIDCPENMLPSCRSCNHYKHTLNLEEFRRYLEKIPEKLIRDNTTYKNGVRFCLVLPNPKPIKFYFETMGGEDSENMD